MAEIIDFERERLKRDLELALEQWGMSIDDMTPNELERILEGLNDESSDKELFIIPALNIVYFGEPLEREEKREVPSKESKEFWDEIKEWMEEDTDK